MNVSDISKINKKEEFLPPKTIKKKKKLNLHKCTLKFKLTIITKFLCIKYRTYTPIPILEVQISKQMHFPLTRGLSISFWSAYRQINALSINLQCKLTNECTFLTKVKVGSANRQINVQFLEVQGISKYIE